MTRHERDVKGGVKDPIQVQPLPLPFVRQASTMATGFSFSFGFNDDGAEGPALGTPEEQQPGKLTYA